MAIYVSQFKSRLFAGAVVIVLIILLSGCSLFGPDEVHRALADVEEAISALENQSVAWQDTLKTLESKLAKDGQSTLATEVSDLTQRAVGTAGVEFRCDADFVRTRLKQSLQNIKVQLQTKAGMKPAGSLIPLAPAVCQVVPPSVDLRLASERQKTVQFYGYDMDLNQPSKLKILLADRNGQEEDVSQWMQIPSHYLMTLNISPAGVPFKPTSEKLVLRWGDNVVGSISVLRDLAPFRAVLFTNAAQPTDHPTITADVPSGYRLIGGGCHSDWQGAGQLLINSYPSGNSWVCGAKDHAVPDPAGLTAYAVAVPETLKLDVIKTSVSGQRVPGVPGYHSFAKAPIPSGYQVIGGGCSSSWRWPQPGNYLVRSYPVSDGWVCYSKDHNGAYSEAIVTSYVIGIKSTELVVVYGNPVISPSKGGRNQQSATLPDGSPAGIVGGGCNVNYGGAGNMLYASYPDFPNNRWMCESKDHQVSDPATIIAFAIGLRWRAR